MLSRRRFFFSRFLVLIFLFSLQLKASASLFQIAAFLNKGLVNIFEGGERKLVAANSGSSGRINDEDFSVILGKGDGALLVSEKSFDEILREIKDLREKIVSIGKSSTEKYAALQKIYEFNDDSTKLFISAWREHFVTLAAIIKARGTNVFIPNSILVAYLQFVTSKVIHSDASTMVMTDQVHFIIREMVRTATKAEIIEIILKPTCSWFFYRQKISLLEAAHLLLRDFSLTSVKLDQVKLKNTVPRVYSIFLLLLKYLEIDINSFNQVKLKFPPPPLFGPFVELVMPFYPALLHAIRNQETIDHLDLRTFTYKGPEPEEILKVLDFFIKQTDFNDNFMKSSAEIQRKSRLFHKIRRYLFRDEILINVLSYCVDHKLKNLYESLLIYSARGPEFTEAVYNLLRVFLISGLKGISYYATILAVSPQMTVEIFDELLIDVISRTNGKIRIDAEMPKGFRRMILALKSIDASIYWDMSPELLEMIQTDPSSRDPKELDFYHLARVYLFRFHGIPFNRTMIKEDICEDVHWSEMIGFINLILEKECKRAGIDDIPKILTRNTSL